jgi:hypothetical protein
LIVRRLEAKLKAKLEAELEALDGFEGYKECNDDVGKSIGRIKEPLDSL